MRSGYEYSIYGRGKIFSQVQDMAKIFLLGPRGELDLPKMKAVALTIEALALLNNEERKKERSATWQLQFTSFHMVLDSRKVQLVIKTHDNEC